MVTKKCIHSNRVVGGGGAVEMAVSAVLRRESKTIEGKLQLVVEGVARSLEVIPRQLCDNAGFASTEILNELRHLHHAEACWMGVDIDREAVCDTLQKGVWEPLADRGVRGCVRHSVGRPDGEEPEEPAGADGGAGAEFGDDECGTGRNPGTEDEYGRNEGAAGKRRKIREGGVFVGKKTWK